MGLFAAYMPSPKCTCRINIADILHIEQNIDVVCNASDKYPAEAQLHFHLHSLRRTGNHQGTQSGSPVHSLNERHITPSFM